MGVKKLLIEEKARVLLRPAVGIKTKEIGEILGLSQCLVHQLILATPLLPKSSLMCLSAQTVQLDPNNIVQHGRND